MRESEIVSLIKEIIAETLEAVQEVYDEQIAPMVRFGSPSEVIGKPYEQWNAQDHARAQAVIPHIYTNGYVAGKEVDSLLEAEKGV